MADIIIRQGESRDVEDISRLEIICFKDPWSKESIREEIEENPLAFYVVAEVAGEIVGYGGMWCVVDEGHITNVAIHPDMRRKNVGKAIVSVMLDIGKREGLKQFTLEVRESNIVAIKLYENLGFKKAGIRPGYYKDGENALIMWYCQDLGDRDEK